MFRNFNTGLDRFFLLQKSVEEAMQSNYFENHSTGKESYPGINIFQEKDNTIVVSELPGVKKEDINIEIKNDLLRLSGERELDYPEGASVHRLERRRRVFDRTIKLPYKVEFDQVKAEFKNGILRVVLPRAESEKAREIKIA